MRAVKNEDLTPKDPQQAAGLETAIKEGQSVAEIEMHLEVVRQELKRILAAIRRALPDKEAPEIVRAVDLDWDRAREAVKRLEALLEENDAGAIDVFEESASLLRSALGSTVAFLEEAITGWDFPAALEALRLAKSDCNELK